MVSTSYGIPIAITFWTCHTQVRDAGNGRHLGGAVTRASVRRSVRIRRPADDVWALIGDPARLPEWFPGIVEATVDGDTRVITTGAGIPMPEQILTNDAIARRFQYRITAPMFREHVSTLDVHDLDDDTCLVVYAADADPATMALVIAGAAGSALEHLRDRMEGSEP
jgi:Polyketide cyclase / dehydrase and lipid transport